MRGLRNAVLFACTACSVHAFKDTVPFLLFSSEAPPSPLKDAFTAPQQSIQRLGTVLSTTKDFVRNTNVDVLVMLQGERHGAVEMLKEAAFDETVHTRYSIPEVLDVSAQSPDELAQVLANQHGGAPILVKVDDDSSVLMVGKNMDHVKSELQRLGLSSWSEGHGAPISNFHLADLAESKARYTVIYIGHEMSQTVPTSSKSPEDDLAYTWQEEFASTQHLDLRRDTGAGKFASDEDGAAGNETDSRGLFEKYQFFTPGIFMGLVATLLLLSIASVGLNAVNSLQVSYAAFEKENGPQSGSAIGGAMKK